MVGIKFGHVAEQQTDPSVFSYWVYAFKLWKCDTYEHTVKKKDGQHSQLNSCIAWLPFLELIYKDR